MSAPSSSNLGTLTAFNAASDEEIINRAVVLRHPHKHEVRTLQLPMRSLKGVAEYLNVSLFHLRTLKVFQIAQDFGEFKAFQL